jgi:hypothetical protein
MFYLISLYSLMTFTSLIKLCLWLRNEVVVPASLVAPVVLILNVFELYYAGHHLLQCILN